MLQAEHITCRVGSKLLIDDISATFVPGNLHLILGPNGAGKSTLIKILCGQMPFQKGSVTYEGVALHQLSVAHLATQRAVLSQHTELTFPMTVSEVVMMGRYPHFRNKPKPEDLNACEEAMRFFDISSMADRDYTTLSGGEKQRVHFARVMAQIWYKRSKGKRYLFLDEPLTFLDVYYQYNFMNQVRHLLQEGDLAVIGVVHDLNLAAKYADRIILLTQGKVIADGTKEEVLTAENIESVYHLPPKIIEQGGNSFIVF